MRLRRTLAFWLGVALIVGLAVQPGVGEQATLGVASTAPAPASRVVLPVSTAPTPAPAPVDIAPDAVSAALVDAASGQILAEKNAHERRPIASITKLMTMALVLDAIHAGRASWNDRVVASENAWRTGGAQIWLHTGEAMSLKDLFTAVAVVSANDAAVALAEHVAGSLGEFVRLMNEKDAALGMRDTVYQNPTGLDAPGAVSSAHDVALVSRYLVTHYPEVLRFTSIFDTYLRTGIPGKKPLWLVSTNKVCIRFYQGCDGLKTGWTNAAGYGVSVTAKRGPTRLIAVVLGCPSSKVRNAAAQQLLSYGFARFATVVVARQGQVLAQLPVEMGRTHSVPVAPEIDAAVTVERGKGGRFGRVLELPQLVEAPLRRGQRVGAVIVTRDGQSVGRYALVAQADVPRIGVWRLFLRLVLSSWPWRG